MGQLSVRLTDEHEELLTHLCVRSGESKTEWVHRHIEQSYASLYDEHMDKLSAVAGLSRSVLVKLIMSRVDIDAGGEISLVSPFDEEADDAGD